MPETNRYDTLTDEELLQRYRSTGDNEWLGNLLQRYTLLLLGVAMKYLKDKDLAEDAVQQIFLKTLTHLPKDEILNFKGWLYVLMRNHCLQQLRDRNHVVPEEVIQHIPDTPPHIEELQQKEQDLQLLELAIGELNEEQKACIRMFYFGKLSYTQITDKTGFSFMQVKSFIQNGKRNLKLILMKKKGGLQP